MAAGCSATTEASAIAPKAPSTMKSPCAVLVSRITPNISDWPSAKRQYRPPSSSPWIKVSITSSAGLSFSDAEVRAADLLARELVGAAFERHATFLETVDPLRYLLRRRHVLLDDDHRHAAGDDRRQRRIDLADDDGREPERQLVAQQQGRVAHQCA